MNYLFNFQVLFVLFMNFLFFYSIFTISSWFSRHFFAFSSPFKKNTFNYEPFVLLCYYVCMESKKSKQKNAIQNVDNVLETVGQRIRKSRIKKGMSIQELADKLERDYSFVVKYEKDVRAPKDDLLEKIGDILGVSYLYLKNGTYFQEIDEFGGIFISYYSSEKYDDDFKKNDSNFNALNEKIKYLQGNNTYNLDFIKILLEISNNLCLIKDTKRTREICLLGCTPYTNLFIKITPNY